nr:hypothetical protein [Tanacetum cinerariifolium]
MHDTEDTGIFKLDTQEIVYTVDMFQDTLNLLVETLEKPFVTLVNIEINESFMNRVGYQGVVDKEIRATDDYKEYETLFIKVVILLNQPQSVVSTQRTHRKKNVDEGEKDAQSCDDFDDSDNRLEPGSHKENPDYVDDDKDEENVDEEEGNEIGSLEIRTEKIQTPIPPTPRSPRINLSLDKNIITPRVFGSLTPSINSQCTFCILRVYFKS